MVKHTILWLTECDFLLSGECNLFMSMENLPGMWGAAFPDEKTCVQRLRYAFGTDAWLER